MDGLRGTQAAKERDQGPQKNEPVQFSAPVFCTGEVDGVRAMRIVSDFPPETLTIERSRDTAAMTLDEILICFAANIHFVADDDRVLMSFEEAPLLGFATSFMFALDEIKHGERESGFTDFYGTFKIRLCKETTSTTTIEEEWGGCKVSVDTMELMEACRSWGREIVRQVASGAPDLCKNPHMARIEHKLLHFAEERPEREHRTALGKETSTPPRSTREQGKATRGHMEADDHTGQMLLELSSNDGWNCLTLSSAATITGGDDRRIVANAQVTGQFWDARATELQGIEAADLIDDFRVVLSQLVISLSRLRELCDLLTDATESWEVQLGDQVGSQVLTLRVSYHDPEVISGDKPVLTIRYLSSRLAGQVRFVTDQSCLRLARETLEGWLAANASNA